MLDLEIEAVDSFYKNEKFMDDTDKSFVRVRASSYIHSLQSNKHKISVKARLSLNRTKKNIRLFIEGDEDEDGDVDGISTNDSKINMGISYLTPEYYGINSKYSIGISGFHPYISARYKTKYELSRWLVEPVQSFKYIIDGQEFEEKTNIYFDTKIDNLKLFRVRLSRGTKTDKDGMDYGASLTYFHSPIMDASISLSQSFSGNTKYEYENDNDEIVAYHGINNYSTDISWRQSIWKKWFFYELKPGVDFRRSNNYKANYKILVLTDFYFGYY